MRRLVLSPLSWSFCGGEFLFWHEPRLVAQTHEKLHHMSPLVCWRIALEGMADGRQVIPCGVDGAKDRMVGVAKDLRQRT